MLCISQWASILLHSVAEHEFLTVFHSLTSCVAHLTVALNPFVCTLLYDDFRKCYKRTFPWCVKKKVIVNYDIMMYSDSDLLDRTNSFRKI